MAEEVYDIYVMVKETGAVIHASESEWCRIEEIKPGREWNYGFEEMKGQPSPDYDYDEPLLHVQKIDGRLQLTIKEYHGGFHVDVFAFNQLVWRDVGGPEHRHVGDSVIVELPEIVPPVPAPPPAPPPFPPPPAPPEWKPATDRLDLIYALLQEIKAEMVPLVIRANTYSVVTIDLGTARPTLTEYPVSGFAVTIFKCTGTMDLKLGNITTDVITIEPLTYPEMIVIDRMDFDRFFIRNTAQAGKEAVLIVWRRE